MEVPARLDRRPGYIVMEKEKVVIVLIGGKWHDKINGNTYYNTKIITHYENGKTTIDYSGFAYGYGRCYYSEVRQEVEFAFEGFNYELSFIDGGSFFMNKRECQKGWF